MNSIFPLAIYFALFLLFPQPGPTLVGAEIDATNSTGTDEMDVDGPASNGALEHENTEDGEDRNGSGEVLKHFDETTTEDSDQHAEDDDNSRIGHVESELKRENARLALEYQAALQRQKNELLQLELDTKALKARSELEKAKHETELSQGKRELEALTVKSQLETVRRRRDTESIETEAATLAAKNSLLKQQLLKLKTELEMQALRYQQQIQEVTQATSLADARRAAKKKVVTEFTYSIEPYDKGVLHVTDRRITLNGVITMNTADHIAERIQFFNNHSTEYPIFLVIDSSPGGSVMAGYRILKAMQGSKAPVHVVVKSFAASMAAILTTLAEHSYAYPNAVLLHHQMSGLAYGNLRQQEEQLTMAKEWSRRLVEPVCEKLGLKPADFVTLMYNHNSDGNWEMFADAAKQHRWVDEVVHDVRELSIVDDPSVQSPPVSVHATGLAEQVDEHGKRYVRLPRLDPFDFWFLYNPDHYFRP